jgi:hypothetical protein
MISKTDRDSAIDQVHHGFIEMLKDWMNNEKNNLDGFIANPAEHVNWTPYMVPDYNALQIRSAQLGQVALGLNVIALHKQGLGPTRTQHDMALDQLPSVILKRLLDWMVVRYKEMLLATTKQNMAPIKEYEGLFSFDLTKYQAELERYKLSIEGLTTVYSYALEREAAVI